MMEIDSMGIYRFERYGIDGCGIRIENKSIFSTFDIEIMSPEEEFH